MGLVGRTQHQQSARVCRGQQPRIRQGVCLLFGSAFSVHARHHSRLIILFPLARYPPTRWGTRWLGNCTEIEGRLQCRRLL